MGGGERCLGGRGGDLGGVGFWRTGIWGGGLAVGGGRNFGVMVGVWGGCVQFLWYAHGE